MNFYVYDFDKTIYDGDCSIDFILFSYKKKKIVFKYLFIFMKGLILYKFKKIDKTKFKELTFSFLKDFDNIEVLLKEFWEVNENKIKEFYKNKKHDKDIIISASPYFLLKPIIDKYNVYDLIATDMNYKNGKIKGKNCKGNEKVRLLKKKYPEFKIKEMYTDSYTDLPLLQLAEKGYIVKKNNIMSFEGKRG